MAKYSENQLPLETVYSDIDYMDNYRDFTVDPVNYQGLSEFVDNLHNNSQHYIPILDAGVAMRKGYEAFEDGVNRDIFIKNFDNQTVYTGQMWPGDVAFPDWLNYHASEYWQDWLGKFYD